MSGSRKAVGRGEKVLPGIWRLRLPLPWSNSPHGNAWALAAGEGIVLVDTGYAGEEGPRQLEFALAQVGFELADISLVVCTHTHADHYGLAGPIVDASDCEVWMHPAWGHVRRMVEDPEGALERQLALARDAGVPRALVDELRLARRGTGSGVARIVEPDRELVSGSTVETDHGTWRVVETPGHAPSHIVLHEPESGLLISGDHLGGKVFLFFDYGHTPDPVGEFKASLEVVEGLDTSLCLPGHGRPYRDVPGKVSAYRREVDGHLAVVRRTLADGPRTVFEIVSSFLGGGELPAGALGWGLQVVSAYVDHLVALGEIVESDGSYRLSG